MKVVDLVVEKVDMLNNKKLLIEDKEIFEYLIIKVFNLEVIFDVEIVYKDVDYVVIVILIDYDL